MVYTLVTFVKPLLDGALRRCGLEKFQLHFATLQECSLNLLVFYDLYCIALQSEDVLEVGEGFFDTLNGNTEMFDV